MPIFICIAVFELRTLLSIATPNYVYVNKKIM